MKDRFHACVPLLLKHEGKFVNDPKDPGGATNMGITIGTLSKWRGHRVTPDEVLALSQDDALEIYRAWYWTQPDIGKLPVGIDRAVFDFAVHSGPARAIVALQRLAQVADDGKLGPITHAAIRKLPPHQVVAELMLARERFLSRLSIWPRYANGWTRRLEEVEDAALEDIAADREAAPSASPVRALVAWLVSLFQNLRTER